MGQAYGCVPPEEKKKGKDAKKAAGVDTSEEFTPSGQGGSPSSGLAPGVEVAVSEIRKAFQEVQEKEDTLYQARCDMADAKQEKRPKREDVVKARALPDLTKLPLAKLEELQKALEKETLELDEKEAQVQEEFLHKFRSSKARSMSSSLTRSGIGGVLSKEEEELLKDSQELAGLDWDFGLSWIRSWQDQPMGPKDEILRGKRREGTKDKVAQELGLRHFGESAAYVRAANMYALGEVHLFFDRTPAARIGKAPSGGSFLLGRYDVVAVKTSADLDRNWNFIKDRKCDFWVAHAAALNVGESRNASDFEDFSQMDNGPDPKLDEERYYEAMEHIMSNVATVCNELRAEHLVFFPFGMGAFLRHLGLLDKRFQRPEDLQRLRRRLARSFVEVLARMTADTLKIHLCLMFGDTEQQCNADAFIRALVQPADDKALMKAVAHLRNRLIVYPEGDSLSLAHELAVESAHVVLLNGANRVMLGNHWFAGRARLAMDENLHRRSWRMAASSYVLNGYDGHEPTKRDPEELLRNASRVKATTHAIDRSFLRSLR